MPHYLGDGCCGANSLKEKDNIYIPTPKRKLTWKPRIDSLDPLSFPFSISGPFSGSKCAFLGVTKQHE